MEARCVEGSSVWVQAPAETGKGGACRRELITAAAGSMNSKGRRVLQAAARRYSPTAELKKWQARQFFDVPNVAGVVAMRRLEERSLRNWGDAMRCSENGRSWIT